MKRLLPIILLILTPKITHAEESVTVPWVEFKQLYHESVERAFEERAKELESREEPLIYVIDEAIYHLRVAEKSAHGEVHVRGKIISGTPRPIPLFGKEMIISGVSKVGGGILLCSSENQAETIHFLPETESHRSGTNQLPSAIPWWGNRVGRFPSIRDG